MENAYYLPSEVLNDANYPEVAAYSEEISALMEYTSEVDLALYQYAQNKVNKIDLDYVELRQAVELCRTLTDILGNAPKVCYEVLIPLREITLELQDLIFLKLRYGNEYVGIPTEVSEEEGE